MKKYYVLGFLFSLDYKKVALIRKNKPEWQAGSLNGIGGKIELIDESPFYAMIREFKEEAGVEVITWKEFCRLNSNAFEVYCYYSSGDLSEVRSMEEEKIEIIEVDNLSNAKVLYNLNWLIPMALDLENINAIVNYQ